MNLPVLSKKQILTNDLIKIWLKEFYKLQSIIHIYTVNPQEYYDRYEELSERLPLILCSIAHKFREQKLTKELKELWPEYFEYIVFYSDTYKVLLRSFIKSAKDNNPKLASSNLIDLLAAMHE